MPTDQLAKGMLVIFDKNTCDQIRIGELHARRLGQRWRIVSLPLEFPDQEVTGADQEWDDAKAPRAAFPIVHRAKKEHETQTDHDENNSPAHVGALTLRVWRRH